MVWIDIGNVEDLVCYDKRVRNALPDLDGLFRQWELGVTLPAMGVSRKRALADILSALPSHAAALEEVFDEEVRVDSPDCAIVRNLETDLEEVEGLGDMTRGMLGLAASRDAERLYISAWR